MESIKLIQSLRKRAEKAVVDMPDGPLKVKAFEVILGRFLNDGSSVDKSRERSEAQSQGPTVRARAHKPQTRKERILTLKANQFFQKPRSIAEVKNGLGLRGWIYPTTGLSGPLQGLVQDGELRRIKDKGWKYVNP